MTPCSSADFQRLAVAARPLPGESLPGFLIRIAERARYRRADLLAGRCGLRQPGSAFTGDDLGPLARLVDIDLERLSEMAYRPVFRRTWHVFGNGVLPREFIDVSRRRFCPRCLSEAPFHRQAWDFALATACHVHRTRLRDRCPKCRRGLGWTHPRIVACRCGQDLRDVAAIEIDDLEAHATEALMELVTRPAPAWLPVALLGCEPAELPWLGMCLGMFMTGWRPQRRIETLVAAGPEAVARVTVAAIGALREWPRPLRIFLDTQRADSSSRPGVYGARKNLGGFYDWLTGLASGGIKDAVAVAVRGLVAEDPELSRRVHRSRLISSGSDGSLIGLNQAKELLGARSERVREMVARGILPGSGAEGRGVPMLIDASAVAALAQRGTQELDLKAAAGKLCVSKARLRLLVARGIIPSTRPTGGASTTWAFDERDLDDMLTKLEGAPEAPYGPGDTVGFEHGVEVMRRTGVGFAEVLQMGLSGALPCRSKDLSANGLKRIGFDAVALRRAAAEMRHDHDRLSVQAAAVRLAMKWDVVRNLVARGILTSTDGTVAAGDVVTFAREHVTGAELACQMATSPRAAAARLAARGVLPIVGSKVDGSRQNIYVRSEAELAMRDAVSDGGKSIGSTSCRARRTP